MIEDLRTDFRRLIAAYEAERFEKGSLEKKLQECMDMNEEYRKRIFELEKKIDSLMLADAVARTSPGGKKEARVVLPWLRRCLIRLRGKQRISIRFMQMICRSKRR